MLGVDVSPLAIDKARAKATAAGAAARACRFEVLDFLAAEPAGGPFDFVLDRGCFHIFDDDAVRARFAARVAAALAPGGQWLSLVGSTEGPPRDVGPPRRTAREVMAAIEPVLELVELRSNLLRGAHRVAGQGVALSRASPRSAGATVDTPLIPAAATGAATGARR